jgi:hypothetical protein
MRSNGAMTPRGAMTHMRPFTAGARLLALAALTAATLAATSASAAATAPFTFFSTFGGPGSGPGQLATPTGVGVNASTHDVYVADGGNQRIDQFHANGEFVRAWGWGVADGAEAFETCTSSCRAGIAGVGAGQLNGPGGVAVDNDPSSPSVGDVYVADPGVDGRVLKFTAEGAVLPALNVPGPGGAGGGLPGREVTVAVDGGGHVYIGGDISLHGGSQHGGNHVAQYDGSAPTNNFLSQFEAGLELTGVAVDSSGSHIYVSSQYGSEVVAWDPTGTTGTPFISELEPLVQALTVDPATGDVFLDRNRQVLQLNSLAEEVQEFGEGTIASSSGLALDTDGTLYVTDSTNSDVVVFGPQAPLAPLVSSESESALNANVVKLKAQVNPNFADTHYFFQYGTDTSYSGGDVPSASGIDIPGSANVNTNQSASVQVSGLQPGTTYHYRAVAVNSQGTTFGPDETFTTLPFGIASFSLGLSSTQAGAHPDFTTAFAFNTDSEGNPVGQVKDIRVDLPVGLVGNPQATPRCTPAELSVFDCKPGAQVGLLDATFTLLGQPSDTPAAVYNMTPSPGHVATFAASVTFATILIQVDVRRDGSYGVQATVSDTSSLLPLQATSLTLWGVPADPGHDAQRIGPAPEYTVPTSAGVPPAPFMINPNDCAAGAPSGSLSVDSWQNPGEFVTQTAALPAPTGCERLQGSPSIAVTPETTQASSPSGYDVDLKVPQNLDPYALMTPDLRNVVLTLPLGTVISPSVANGLAACSQEQFGLNTPSQVTCPDAAKIGTVEVTTPLLADRLEGSVYVARQNANPFGSLLAIYLLVEGDGVQVKLAGQVTPDPVTGQLTTTFLNNPQLPFSDLKVHIFGGPGAALSNPTTCGEARSTAKLTPFSSATPVEPFSSFNVTGCGGSPFAPAFVAGTASNQAGAFSPLSVTISRQDSEQDFSGVQVKTPPGLLGIIKGVERCGEPQAAQGTCGPGSLIGHTTAGAGAGPNPLYVGGQVFLTGPYRGAPFGLSIVVPAVAGPFNLGTVVVRARIEVDPHTAQITVISDPLPSILQGIPLQIKTVNVTIDRTSFMFNPTSCDPLSVDGTLTSTQGASANVASRFQAASCGSLGFHPSFTASTQAATSKKNGASLDVKVGYPVGSQANIRSTAVVLPKQLPARLTTIQQACPEATFAANPASCPAGSDIGIATASTPVLASSLTGPAYLVSHGGAAFPDVTVVLQGEGVTLVLVGSVDIKKGITSSTFASVPDAPISSFDLNLPEGPHSGLAAVVPAKARGSLCGQALTMPTTITGQNGAQITQNTKIAVKGCGKAKPTKKKRKKHKQAKKGSHRKRG